MSGNDHSTSYVLPPPDNRGHGYSKKRGGKYYDKGDDKCSSLTPAAAYIIWFIILVVLIWILRAFAIKWFSTIVFAFVISSIILCFIFPIDMRDGKYNFNTGDALFGIIVVFTIILLIIWFIWKVFTDREEGRGDKGWGWNSWWSGNSSYSKGNPGHGNPGHGNPGDYGKVGTNHIINNGPF